MVVGSGFIAMEVASVLAQKGIETTMIVRDERIWPKIFTPAMSRSFENYFAARGVRFIKQAEVKEARGKEALASVVLNDGRTIECDLMVAGIGVRPVTDVVAREWNRSGGRRGGQRISRNQRARDLCGRRRGQLSGHAVRQAPARGALGQRRLPGTALRRARLMGERAPFVHVPYFFSDVFDLSYELWGDMTGADEVIERGDLASTSFSVWWLKQAAPGGGVHDEPSG